MNLREWFEKKEPLFKGDGKFVDFALAFDYIKRICWVDTTQTEGRVPIRDAQTTKRYVALLMFALCPSFLFGMFNVGYQRFRIEGVSAGFLKTMFFGCLYVLPLLLAVYATGFFWEFFFAKKQNRLIFPGLLVTGMVFVCTLPPSIPIWQAILGMSFGMVFGQEIFGGYGKHFLHPALLGRLFLFLAFPRALAGDAWTSLSPRNMSVLDSKLGVSALSIATHISSGEHVVDVLMRMGFGFWSLFWGMVPGGIGDTSVFCVCLGMVVLLYTRIVNWRILAGILLGVFFGCFFIHLFVRLSSPPIFELPWLWHFGLGGVAFFSVFIATDPATTPHLDESKWVYGLGIGVLTVLIRCLNIDSPEGAMLSILIMMLFSPLIDSVMIHFRLKKRISNEL